MNSSVVRPFSLLLCGAFFLVAVGCGGKTFEVEGTVEMDGKPLDSGSISFAPPEGKGRDFGGVIKDGKYKFTTPPNVEPGKRIVRITGMIKTGKQILAFPPPSTTMTDEINPIPKRYNEKSELSADLEAGKTNHFDFKLKSGS